MINVIDIEGEHFFFDLRDVTFVRATQVTIEGEKEFPENTYFEVKIYFVEMVSISWISLKLGWNNFNELSRKLAEYEAI